MIWMEKRGHLMDPSSVLTMNTYGRHPGRAENVYFGCLRAEQVQVGSGDFSQHEPRQPWQRRHLIGARQTHCVKAKGE